MTTVAIVTPWWNHPELADGYRQALERGGLRASDRVVVVDNGSDPPVDLRTPDAEYLRMGRNAGFSRACNAGMAYADTDAVLFLNNDIALTNDRWLDGIRDNLAPGILVGANLSAPAHAAVDGKTIPYLDGWCLAGWRDDLTALGGWDETFEEPSYFGDNDLCLRARRAGMRLVETHVGLRHISNVTSRVMDVSGVSARNYARYAARVRELLAAA